jgi:hypothetical protein
MITGTRVMTFKIQRIAAQVAKMEDHMQNTLNRFLHIMTEPFNMQDRTQLILCNHLSLRSPRLPGWQLRWGSPLLHLRRMVVKD